MNQIRNISRGLRRRYRDHGTITVEAALVLPILLLVFVAVIDFGRVFYWSLALSNAARVGAEYGAISAVTAAQEEAMEARAQIAASGDIDVANVVNGFNCIACSPGSTSVGCTNDDGTSSNPCLCWNTTSLTESPMATCSTICNGIVHYHVNVHCQATFRTVSSYLGLSPITLTRATRIRVQ